MSKIIASAAIRGAYSIVERAENEVKRAIDAYGPNREVAFPNTGYYLPIIYGIMGYKVQKLADMEHVIKTSRNLLPPPVKENHHLPYLGPALDAGMATFFAEELIEAIKYIDNPSVYVPGEDPRDDNIWLGAADDVIMRKRGVEFVDGTAPGFAAMLGAPENPAAAAQIALELQQKNLYVFMSASTGGRTMSQQLLDQGVQIGWPTRLVPFGSDTSATVFSIGFATRAAMSFGGIDPGDYRKILIYNKDRVFAFGITFGFVNDEWYANGAGCINYGFPVITDTPTPQILPTGVSLRIGCTGVRAACRVDCAQNAQSSAQRPARAFTIAQRETRSPNRSRRSASAPRMRSARGAFASRSAARREIFLPARIAASACETVPSVEGICQPLSIPGLTMNTKKTPPLCILLSRRLKSARIHPAGGGQARQFTRAGPLPDPRPARTEIMALPPLRILRRVISARSRAVPRPT